MNCKIIKGGIIKEESTVQLCDSILDLPQISEEDDRDIDLASDLECDFLISSHTQNGKMVCAIKDRVKQKGDYWFDYISNPNTQLSILSKKKLVSLNQMRKPAVRNGEIDN